MKNPRWVFGASLLTALAVLIGIRLTADPPEPLSAPTRVPSREVPAAPEGFARADGPRAWAFPEDFGPHPAYQTEWWYYTGNLTSQEGRSFGYQLTIFRRGLLPPEERNDRPSAWAADQVFMGHFALTDLDDGSHRGFEVFSRGAAGLAGAQGEPFRAWIEGWSIERTETGAFRLQAEAEGAAVDLILEDRRGLTFHGEDGYSRKGADPGNASYYFSQTRLETAGTVRSGGNSFEVQGLSWMDHEFSTSALSEGQVGWDWFSLQLDGGQDMMVFQIRREDGSIDLYSSGTFLTEDGESLTLLREDFTIDVLDTWTSPRSGAVYPSGWEIRVPDLDLTLEIQPRLPDQEMNVSYRYWEGTVSVRGEYRGDPVSGTGYVELTGYAGSMEGEF